MIKSRQLCFWFAVATASIVAATAFNAVAQQSTDRTAPAEKVVEGKAPAKTLASPPPPPARSSPAPRSSSPPPLAISPASNGRPPGGLSGPSDSAAVKQSGLASQTTPSTQSRAAIISLDPSTPGSEVIRQVVEVLEKQGIAKQLSVGEPVVQWAGAIITVEIQAQPEMAAADVLQLVQSLQKHGVRRIKFARPAEKRNLVIVLAPADVSWRTIDGLKAAITKQKKFAADIRVAEQDGKPESFNSDVETPVRITGSDGKPLSRVPISEIEIQKILRDREGIFVMMGFRNQPIPMLETSNPARVAVAVVAAIKGRPEIKLWADSESLIIQTTELDDLENPRYVVGGEIAQEIIEAVYADERVSPQISGDRIGNVDANSTTGTGNTGPQNSIAASKAQTPAFTMVFRLKRADSTLVANVLKQLFDDGMRIAADAQTNSLIVRGAKSQMEEMKRLVEMLDGSPAKTPATSSTEGTPRKDSPKTPADVGENGMIHVTVPSVSVPETRLQIQEYDRQIREAVTRLRSAQPTSEGKPDATLKTQLRKVVAQAFLARRALQQAELREFAARLERIKQSLKLRNRIVTQIVDRRVDELLDPNLNWDQNVAAGTQKTVVRTQSVIQQQNQGQRVQPAPKQNTAAVGTQPVEVTRPSASTVILRNAGEFRELLRTHARNVGLVHQQIKSFKARAENAVGPEEIANAKAFIEAGEKTLPLVEAERNFVLKEYQTQIQLLESEVETVHLMVKTAEQELDRTKALVDAGVVQSHKLDQHKRELAAALQRLERATVLLDLYQEAGEGA